MHFPDRFELTDICAAGETAEEEGGLMHRALLTLFFHRLYLRSLHIC